jgi:hypothetical protein
LFPLIIPFLATQALLEFSATVSSTFSDPHIRNFPDERIHKDLRFESHRAMRITTAMLPSVSPSLAKWTMVTFDESIMTFLFLDYVAFLDDEIWHSILSFLHLPRLKDLSIGGIHISLRTLVSFINRHPTIQMLTLTQHAILYSSYPQDPNATNNPPIPRGSQRPPPSACLKQIHPSRPPIHPPPKALGNVIPSLTTPRTQSLIVVSALSKAAKSNGVSTFSRTCGLL